MASRVLRCALRSTRESKSRTIITQTTSQQMPMRLLWTEKATENKKNIYINFPNIRLHQLE